MRTHARTRTRTLAWSISNTVQLMGMERQVGDIILKVDGDDVYGKKLAELAEGNWCTNTRASMRAPCVQSDFQADEG